MSRPNPTILLEHVADNYKATQVCEADAVYSVCYRNRPIMLRTHANIEVGYPGFKYSKTNFPSSGHAFNLAERLNRLYNTTDFTVMMMQPIRVIRENT